MMTRYKQDYKEVLLRGIIALLFIGLVLGLSMRKILIAFGINTAEPLVSMNINYRTTIPIWSSFVCGPNFSKVEPQTLKRGPAGTLSDVAKPLPQSFIKQSTTSSLTTGDWTNGGVWPCFVFNPKGVNFKPGENDTAILVVSSDTPLNTTNGLLFGIFDEERNMSSVEPFVAPTPSTNTYTFTRSERLDVNNKLHSYFSANKQNIVQFPFAGNVVARFTYSPDTYLVAKYTEKMAYTPYDLISAVGGLITYTLAAWFILFGRGKYRSWGLVQRYLLRSSPNARKKDGNQLLPSYNNNNEKTDRNSEIIENQNQINSNNTFVNKDDDNSSIYYFSSTGTPTKSNFNFNNNNNNNNNSDNNNNYISPTSILSSPQYLKDLNKRMDAKINEKLWSVEQTLSRHYLAGFKLRKYDVDSKKFGFDYLSFEEENNNNNNNNDKQILTPPTIHNNWNNLDSGRTIRKFHSTSSLSQVFSNNNNNEGISNPEEQRSQYPNISINQVPLEKKQRGRNSGSYQNNNNIFTNEINNNNGPFPSSSSSSNNVNNNSNITNYTPQSDNNNNNNPSLSQLSSVYYGSR